MCHFMLPTSVDATWTLNMFPAPLPPLNTVPPISLTLDKTKNVKDPCASPSYYTLYVFVLFKVLFFAFVFVSKKIVVLTSERYPCVR